MSRIGGGPKVPTPGTNSPSASQADLKSQEGVKNFQKAAGASVPQKVVDSFQRAGGNIEAKLQSLSGTALAQKLNFTNEDLALLARTFAGVLRGHPNADRKMRSKLFARAILQKKGLSKRSRLAQLLDDEDNDELDERDRQALQDLYDLIAEQLDSTPVFAQLVDEVTESARKLT